MHYKLQCNSNVCLFIPLSCAFQVHILYYFPDNCQDSHQLRSRVTQADCFCAGHQRQAEADTGTGDCFRVNWPTLTLHIFFRISLFFTSSILTFSSLSASVLTISFQLEFIIHISQNAVSVCCDYFVHLFHDRWVIRCRVIIFCLNITSNVFYHRMQNYVYLPKVISYIFRFSTEARTGVWGQRQEHHNE